MNETNNLSEGDANPRSIHRERWQRLWSHHGRLTLREENSDRPMPDTTDAAEQAPALEPEVDDLAPPERDAASDAKNGP